MSVLVYIICVRGGYLVELDDVGMPQHFQDADFPCHSLYVRLLHYLLLLEGLNCHLLSSGKMDSQPHLTESALSDALALLFQSLPILYWPSTNSPDVLIYIIKSFLPRQAKVAVNFMQHTSCAKLHQ